MCIQSSVGKNSKNEIPDVKVIQAALNLVFNKDFKLKQSLTIDGKIGDKTISAIESFQTKIVGLKNPDGRIDPNGKTINKLKQVIRKGLNINSFSAIMAYASKNTLLINLPYFQSLLPKYNIDQPLRLSHFMAQIGHESMSLKYTEELASGDAYEGRKDLGNIEKGDGKRFKGRGYIQLTGRANYEAYSKHSGIDLLKPGQETLLSSNLKYALDVSLWFWSKNNLNKRADMDDIRAVTKRVNGGYNGLDDRTKYLCRAKFFFL